MTNTPAENSTSPNHVVRTAVTPTKEALDSPSVSPSIKHKVLLRNSSAYKSAEQLDSASDDVDDVQLRRRPPRDSSSSVDACDDAVGRRWPIGNNFRDRRNSRSAEHIPEKLEQCFVVRSASGTHATGLDGVRMKPVPDSIHGELLHALLKHGKESNRDRGHHSRSSSTDNCCSQPLSSDEQSDDPLAVPRTTATMMPPLQNHQAPNSSVPNDDHRAGESLIMPKKLTNPCLESYDHKLMHRELKFNQKIGKSVLNQKSELQKALDKQKSRQQLNAQLQESQQKPEEPGLAGELGRVIMQRAQRIESLQNHAGSDGENGGDQHQLNPEYLKIRAKLRATDAK